jgi:PAS domain S-box-containing protein
MNEKNDIEGDSYYYKRNDKLSDYQYALDESCIVAITDQKGIIQHVNRNFCEISKYSEDELLGQDHRIINSGFHSKEFIRNLWVTIANGKIWKGELKNKAKDGSYYWVDTTIVPFLNDNGKPYKYLAIRSDISDRKKTEEQLEMSLKEISNLKYAIDESTIVSISDEHGIIKHVNKNYCSISGFDKNELLGQDHRIVNSGFHSKEFFSELWDTVSMGKIWKGEIRNKAKGGTFYWVDTTIVPFLDTDNKPFQYVSIKNDITARVEALEEKKVLLKELYHRTKNNMQVVSSLLNLKKSLVQDQQITNILEEMGNRIMSMSLVHQKLYQSQNLSSLDLKEYITDFAGLIIKSYSSFNETISLTLDLESICVEIDTAIPFGLVLNELITNSLKYAFPDDMKGEIIIRLYKPEPDVIELIVSDNGIGIKGDIDFEHCDTLGMQLLKYIGEGQLNGQVNYETQNGVKYTLRFRNNYTT